MSLLRTETIEYEGAAVTVRSATLLSELQRVKLLKALREAVNGENGYTADYASLCVQTVKVKAVGFEFPAPDAPIQEHVKAYEAFLTLPIPFADEWANACNRVNAPPKRSEALSADATSADPKSASVA